MNLFRLIVVTFLEGALGTQLASDLVDTVETTGGDALLIGGLAAAGSLIYNTIIKPLWDKWVAKWIAGKVAG